MVSFKVTTSLFALLAGIIVSFKNLFTPRTILFTSSQSLIFRRFATLPIVVIFTREDSDTLFESVRAWVMFLCLGQLFSVFGRKWLAFVSAFQSKTESHSFTVIATLRSLTFTRTGRPLIGRVIKKCFSAPRTFILFHSPIIPLSKHRNNGGNDKLRFFALLESVMRPALN